MFKGEISGIKAILREIRANGGCIEKQNLINSLKDSAFFSSGIHEETKSSDIELVLQDMILSQLIETKIERSAEYFPSLWIPASAITQISLIDSTNTRSIESFKDRD